MIVDGKPVRDQSLYAAWYALEDRHHITRQEAADRLGVGVDSLRSALSEARRRRGLPVDKRPPGGTGKADRHRDRRQALLEDAEFLQEANPNWRPAQVAERLGVSERCIQRARKALDAAA